MADTAIETSKKGKGEPKKMKMPNKWIIGLLLLVLVLGGLSVYQMKKNKELQEQLKKKSESKGKGIDLDKRPVKTKVTTDSEKDFVMAGDDSNTPIADDTK